MQIKVYENSLRARWCGEILASSRLASRFSEIIILPIPSTRDGLHLAGEERLLSDAVSYADEDTLVVGYGLPEELTESLGALGATVFDAALDEAFLLENARLTAVATLGILLGSENRAPSDMRIGIAGLGRIGKHLLESLLYLGATVRVFTSREAVRRELAEAGVESGELPIARQSALDGVDILINTAPIAVFEGVESCLIPGEVRIIDLASGATIPPSARAERYPSLPARMLPVSAGRAYAEAAERFLLLLGYGEAGK